MKTFTAAIALFASAALAQDLSALPPCGQNCITSMLGLAQSLGCSATEVACLCANENFGYGVRDCSAQSCPPDTDLSGIEQFAVQYCGAPEATTGTFSDPGAAATAATETPGVTDPAATATGSDNTTSATDSAASATETGGTEGNVGAITTSEILSTITTDGSTITSTIGSTTIFSSGVTATETDATAAASSLAGSASESVSSVLSTVEESVSSAVESASSAASEAAAEATGGAYPMATVAMNGVAGIAGLAALLVL